MPPSWFTPEQFIKAHQYVWEKLEREQNKVSMVRISKTNLNVKNK